MTAPTLTFRAIQRFVLALLFVATLPVALSQDWAQARLDKSPRHREWITVKHDGRSVEVLAVYPESKEKRPVVLIVHEIFGMTDWVEDLADQVAEAGYIAIAPDLLSGMGTNGSRSTEFFARQGDRSGKSSQSGSGYGRSDGGV